MSPADDGMNAGQFRTVIRSVAIPVALAAVTISTGTLGYLLYLPTLTAFDDASTVRVVSEGFFRSLRFLVLGMGTITAEDPTAALLLTASRAGGFLFAFYAALASVSLVFAKQLRPLRIEAWAQLGRLPGFTDRGHVIVCGIGDDGYTLATEALDDGRNVVAIDTERDDRTAALERRGAVFIEGDASHDGVLARRARLPRAADVFVTTGDDGENGAIVETIAQQADGRSWSQVIDVTARIDDHRLRRTLHEEATSTDGFDLRTYSVPEATARELLASHPVDDIDDRDQRIHVWLVGWTALSEALVDQLLHLMHYPDGVDRRVTVITDVPDRAERDIAALSPGIDPDWWNDESMRRFVDELFPDIDVRSLPSTDMLLLSDKFPLYDELEENDTLTVIADGPDARSLRSLVSVWAPKLDDLTEELGLDTQLLYRGSDDTNDPVSTAEIRTAPYTAFGSGCSIDSVRGDTRDRIARRLALVYHVLYEAEPWTILQGCDAETVGSMADIDSVFGWLGSLSEAERERYATTVWRDIPEYKRESNRHAADHAAVKHRMARILGAVGTTPDRRTLRALAESEHRRWCAEKILDGWEPLPDSETERWNSDEQALREQRYHPEIRSVESLRAETDGEWEKDISQVKAVLDHPEIIAPASRTSPSEDG